MEERTMKKIIKNSIKIICFALLVLGTLTMKCDMETKADELVNKIKYQISNGGAHVTGVEDISVEVVNITATITVGKYTYKVESIKEKAFLDNSTIITVDMSRAKYLTYIGRYAFSGCTNLNTIKFSNVLKKISTSAFYNCDALETITIPKSLTAYECEYPYTGLFIECDNLNRIVFENGLKQIPYRICKNVPGLRQITIPNSVISIEEEAFMGCSQIEAVNIPKTVQTIGEHAFAECSHLESVTLNDGILTLGNGCFEKCDSLASVILPKSITKYDVQYPYDGVFAYCDSLKKIVLQNGFRYIPDSMLKNTTGLEEIVIPETVSYIGYRAFYNCDSLVTVKIPKSVKTIYNEAFAECLCLKNVQFSEGLQKMYTGSFENCDSIEKIILPISLVDMEQRYPYTGAFDKCDRLEVAIFKNGAKKIPARLLRGTPNLKEVTIPGSVTEIGEEAFADTCLVQINGAAGSVAQKYAKNNGIKFVSNVAYATAIPKSTLKSVKTPGAVKAKKLTATSIKLSWKKVTGINGYEIYIATKKNFSDKKITTSSKTSIYKKLTKKKKGKTYYLKIRAYRKEANGKKTYSKFSKVVKCKL